MQGLWRPSRLTRLCLSRPLYEQIVNDTRGTPQFEICGLLAGHGHTCDSVYPIKNISPTPKYIFYMDPQMQIAAMSAMRQCGERLLGIYHSHPTTAAKPSARDVDGATYPGIAYLIIALNSSLEPDVAAFTFEQGTFKPMVLEISAIKDN